MDKLDIKKFLKQTEKIVKDLGSKAGNLAKTLEKDASYGTKAGIVKIEQLSLENEKNKVIKQLGKRTYELLRKKEISHKKFDDILKKINDIENKIRGKKASLTRLKQKRKAKTKKK